MYNLDALTYAGNLENRKDIENKKTYTLLRGDITSKSYIKSIFSQYRFDSGMLELNYNLKALELMG